MSATLYQFPKLKSLAGLKIPLYNEEEIAVTIMVLNCFSELQEKITEKTLTNLEPTEVLKSLYEARYSSVFSGKTKLVINKILKSIETV